MITEGLVGKHWSKVDLTLLFLSNFSNSEFGCSTESLLSEKTRELKSELFFQDVIPIFRKHEESSSIFYDFLIKQSKTFSQIKLNRPVVYEATQYHKSDAFQVTTTFITIKCWAKKQLYIWCTYILNIILN